MIRIIKAYELQQLPLFQFTKEGIFIKEWLGISATAKELNICDTNIIKCCKFKRKSTGGFLWSYSRNPTYYAPMKRFLDL